MLVLSRKVGQEILIGDNVRITITKVSGNRVTLGIEAPDHVRILRGELGRVVLRFQVLAARDEQQRFLHCFAVRIIARRL